MNKITRANFKNIYSEDKELQYEAFLYLLDATAKPVDWAYEVWDEMVASLSHKNNRVRAIASQILCNLAQSDPENKMQKDFDTLLAVTKDDRFVTARHCMQNIWKVGVVGKEQQKQCIKGLEVRYHECSTEKNCTLIRYDIIQGLRNLYNEVRDETIKKKALELIETEDDLKYRKKYARVWKEK